ncbi:MAG: DUF1080 domain-containing protein [Planctomycetia bacterium]|nr:DUF1080 domain-containing protein [Planctomycetia bacterium]
MSTLPTLLLCTLFSWTLPTPVEVADGWIALFDGETFYGWQPPLDTLGEIQNGTLILRGGECVHRCAFGKATLRYEYHEGDGNWKTVTRALENTPPVLVAAEGKVTTFRKVFLRPERMEPLFNGENLDSWNQYPEMPGRFSVDCEKRRLLIQDGPGMLETKDSYGDFVLQASIFTAAKNLNSGIFFRCIPGEKMNGYESQIHNGCKDGDRTQPLDAGTGAIFRRTTARYVPANDEELFYKTIVANGPHFAVWVNGLQVTDWTDTRKANPNPRRGLRLEAGTIMLQAHDPTTDVYFQNIGIQSLD